MAGVLDLPLEGLGEIFRGSYAEMASRKIPLMPMGLSGGSCMHGHRSEASGIFSPVKRAQNLGGGGILAQNQNIGLFF